MRVLLDAHLSGRSIGGPLRAAGHDVLALDENLGLKQLSDADVLELAVDQGRIIVTANIRDFARLAPIVLPPDSIVP